MNRGFAALILCLTLVSGTMAWSAPQPARTTAKPAVKRSAGVYEIAVSFDGGGAGRFGGSGEGWKLRSDGTAEHTISLSPAEMDYEVGQNPPHTTGTIDPEDFAGFHKYLQYSRLLDLKVPPDPNDMGAFMRVSLTRSGKTKSILIPASAPESAATVAGWVIGKIVRSITAGTDWKNDAGLSVNTGFGGKFVWSLDGLSAEEANRVHGAIFTVRDDKGKEVGHVSQSNEYGTYRLIVPPGTYHVALDESKIYAAGYIWRTAPATIVVSEGKITEVDIIWEKKSSP
jgi:hypothetical protein